MKKPWKQNGKEFKLQEKENVSVFRRSNLDHSPFDQIHADSGESPEE